MVTLDGEIDWRKVELDSDKYNDDDDEQASPDVIDMLGFDPFEAMEEDGWENASSS